MKLQLVSDLHLEFHIDKGESCIKQICQSAKDVDALVIAGDLCECRASNGLWRKSLEKFCGEFKRVIYVPGNHEYYGLDIDTVDEMFDLAWNDQATDNLDIMDGITCYDTSQFLGGTLWFEDSHEAKSQERYFSDFLEIKDLNKWVYLHNKFTKRLIETRRFTNQIIITHHLPAQECVAEKYRGSDINCYFANNLGELIKEKKPKLWLYGHTHESNDFVLGETRLVCNPLGYCRGDWTKAENKKFNPNLVIEI